MTALRKACWIAVDIAVLSILTVLHVALGNVSRQNRYTKTSGKLVPSPILTTHNMSRIECCSECELQSACRSVNYNLATGECQLARETLGYVQYLGADNYNWNNYAKDDWLLIFRATPGVGGDLYYAWRDGVSVTTTDVTCMTTDATTCSKHYRHTIIDSWSSLTVSKVKLAAYKNNVEVAYIIFNGTGSTKEDWFQKSRVLQSTYTNLAQDTYNYFSILGHDPGRRFFINRSYGGCPADTAYFVAVVSHSFSCNHDAQSSFPQFIYSTSSSYGSPDSMTGMALADLMAVFIK